MSTTSNFFEALKLIKPVEKVDIFYRLYYNKTTGEPISYSMEDLSGDFIEITKEEFALTDFNIFVKDGKIKKKNITLIGKLVPGSTGFPVHKHDITIIDTESKYYLTNKTYDNDD